MGKIPKTVQTSIYVHMTAVAVKMNMIQNIASVLTLSKAGAGCVACRARCLDGRCRPPPSGGEKYVRLWNGVFECSFIAFCVVAVLGQPMPLFFVVVGCAGGLAVTACRW